MTKNTISKKLWAAVAIATVSGVVGVAGIAAATSTGDDGSAPTTGRDRGDRAAQVCEHFDQIQAKMAQRSEHLTSRLASLADRRAEAVAAGNDRLVDRIDRLTARLTERSTEVQDRTDRLAAWATEHCPAP